MDRRSYRTFPIPKRDGSSRLLAEPRPALKRKQKGILRWLKSRGIRPSPYAHGFVRGRSTATHAKLHLRRKVLLKVDLVDFFGRTTRPMVHQALREAGIDEATAAEISEACTLEGSLPQGAPPSPFLANLVLKRLDHRMAGLAKARSWKYPITYSRYADDLVFSSDDPQLNHLLPAIEFIVKDAGYELNHRKTRILRRSERQIVTGVVVNRKPNPPRSLRRTLRARLHNLKTAILDRKALDGKELGSVSGMVAYIHGIRPDLSSRYSRDLKEIGRLQDLRRKLQPS